MCQPYRSIQLVIRNSKGGPVTPSREDREDPVVVGSEREAELNNNSVILADNNLPGDRECSLAALDLLIEDQYNILSLAVQNILAVSSEEIYSSKVQDKKLSSDCTENGNCQELVEDIDFKEALHKFSEETLSMSKENILSDKNISKSLGRKYLNGSFNTFPMIEGRSPILYFILICF